MGQPARCSKPPPVFRAPLEEVAPQRSHTIIYFSRGGLAAPPGFLGSSYVPKERLALARSLSVAAPGGTGFGPLPSPLRRPEASPHSPRASGTGQDGRTQTPAPGWRGPGPPRALRGCPKALRDPARRQGRPRDPAPGGPEETLPAEAPCVGRGRGSAGPPEGRPRGSGTRRLTGAGERRGRGEGGRGRRRCRRPCGGEGARRGPASPGLGGPERRRSRRLRQQGAPRVRAAPGGSAAAERPRRGRGGAAPGGQEAEGRTPAVM